jgi:hypothetical protein
MGEWTRKKSNCPNENDKDIDTNHETFTIDRNSSNQKYIIHNFRVDYQQRPIHFNTLCPYEFCRKINKINDICCHWFNNEHPQYNTHILYELEVPKISILQSYTIPSKENNPKYCAQTICILFTSWHTIFDIKSDFTMSWEMTLKNVYPTFTNLQKKK